MWDAPPAPPDPPTGSTTHQRDPRPHLQKSRTQIKPSQWGQIELTFPTTSPAWFASDFVIEVPPENHPSLRGSLGLIPGERSDEQGCSAAPSAAVSYTHLRAH